MIFQIIWFVLWGVLWAVYFMLDGFDFGAGMLHPFIARSDAEARLVIDTIGPVWNGNEVWLITAGGATFAAFPTTYAVMFSSLYTPLLLILFALIIRGLALEFRSQSESRTWRMGWDIAIFLGSAAPALLLGVAFGNIFKGLPMDAAGYHGSLLTLLNPYGIHTGLLFVLLFIFHGSVWLTLRTGGDFSRRASTVGNVTWYILLLTAGAFLVHTAFATHLYDNYYEKPVLFLIPAIAVVALVGAKCFLHRGSPFKSFLYSCLTVLGIVFTGIAGLYPNLIPSSLDPAYSLTAFNSSSSPYTLKIMTVVALVFVPIVIAYQIWVYRIFSGKTTAEDVEAEGEGY